MVCAIYLLQCNISYCFLLKEHCDITGVASKNDKPLISNKNAGVLYIVLDNCIVCIYIYLAFKNRILLAAYSCVITTLLSEYPYCLEIVNILKLF